MPYLCSVSAHNQVPSERCLLPAFTVTTFLCEPQVGWRLEGIWDWTMTSNKNHSPYNSQSGQLQAFCLKRTLVFERTFTKIYKIMTWGDIGWRLQETPYCLCKKQRKPFLFLRLSAWQLQNDKTYSYYAICQNGLSRQINKRWENYLNLFIKYDSENLN